MMATPDVAPKSTSTAPTRGWALDMANATVRIKPRRPYTPYNLFYLLERELVVQGHEPLVAKEKAKKKASMEAEKMSKIGKRPEDDIPLPARYKNVVMLPMWYEPNLKEKRKHRKTHGKISFKDLTEIISKNWATIDAETKDYCTRVSEMGRKRYKEQMLRYNASQKIIQLKKEHAAMENARGKRSDSFHKKDCGSPSRPEKGERNPTTPDRILSQHAPIVTPPNHGYNNRVPMFVPSGPPHAFHHYGPPPPMPPPMPSSMQGQPTPLSMPMYHQRHHQNQHHNQYQHQLHHQHQHQYQYQQKYQPGQQHQHPHQYQPKHQPKHQHQQKYQHQHHHQNQNQNQHQHQRQHQHQHQHQNREKHYQNQSQNHHQHQHRQLRRHQYSYPQAASKMNSSGHKQAALKHGDEHNQAMKFSKGKDTGSGSVNFLSSLPNSGLDVTVDVKVSLKKEEPGDRNSMTHDEAMRLCNLMGHDSPGQKRGDHGGDTLLSEMPSFDAGDQHSLSTEPGSDSCREVHVDGILNPVENQEENILDMIRSELLPLGFGEEESLDSFPDM